MKTGAVARDTPVNHHQFAKLLAGGVKSRSVCFGMRSRRERSAAESCRSGATHERGRARCTGPRGRTPLLQGVPGTPKRLECHRRKRLMILNFATAATLLNFSINDDRFVPAADMDTVQRGGGAADMYFVVSGNGPCRCCRSRRIQRHALREFTPQAISNDGPWPSTDSTMPNGQPRSACFFTTCIPNSGLCSTSSSRPN